MTASLAATPPPLPTARRRWVAWGLFGLVLLGLVTVHVIDPVSSPFAPSCAFHTVTGYHCPGCGGTRAMHALLHGQWRQAIAHHPLLPLVLGFGAWWLWRTIRPSTNPGKLLPAWGVWSILAALVLFWIARNIPRYPFTLLAP